MMFRNNHKRDLSLEEKNILREHWLWGGNYAILWIVVTIAIFAGAYFLFDYLNVDVQTRILSFILLSTLVLLNAIWRAAGALAARLELTRRKRRE